MSNIAKRGNGKWRARYRDDAGREHARHFERKLDAQRWLDQTTAALVTGQYVDPQAGKVTLTAYAKAWQATQRGRPSTLALVDNALRLHILPALGSRPMASIRHSDIQGFVKDLDDRYSIGQVRNVSGILTRLFAAAVEDRVVPGSPCRKVKVPKIADAEVVPPTVEEVAAAIEAAPERYRAAVILLAGSGLRIGELLGLRVSDVDFLRRSVRVERQRLQSGGVGEPKTDKSRRTVPLSQVVLDELAAHLARYPSGEWLFTAPDGGPVAYSTHWKPAWERIRKVVGFEHSTHDMRHFFASAQIAGGASVKQVQSVLGHGSAAITLKVYAHLWPGDDDQTREVMESTLGFLRTDCGLDAPQGGESPGQTG